jgi:hypothetical protein
MNKRKDFPKLLRDIEKPHETVAESFSDGLGGELLTVRLGALWTDLIRVEQRSDPDTSPRSPSAVPLLDDMKGILHWD